MHWSSSDVFVVDEFIYWFGIPREFMLQFTCEIKGIVYACD